MITSIDDVYFQGVRMLPPCHDVQRCLKVTNYIWIFRYLNFMLLDKSTFIYHLLLFVNKQLLATICHLLNNGAIVVQHIGLYINACILM